MQKSNLIFVIYLYFELFQWLFLLVAHSTKEKYFHENNFYWTYSSIPNYKPLHSHNNSTDMHSTQFNSENLRSFFHLMLKTFHELCYFSNFSQRPFVTYCHLKENHHVMACIFHFASLQLQKMHLHNLFLIDHVEKSTKTKKIGAKNLKCLLKYQKRYVCVCLVKSR